PGRLLGDLFQRGEVSGRNLALLVGDGVRRIARRHFPVDVLRRIGAALAVVDLLGAGEAGRAIAQVVVLVAGGPLTVHAEPSTRPRPLRLRPIVGTETEPVGELLVLRIDGGLVGQGLLVDRVFGRRGLAIASRARRVLPRLPRSGHERTPWRKGE